LDKLSLVRAASLKRAEFCSLTPGIAAPCTFSASVLDP